MQNLSAFWQMHLNITGFKQKKKKKPVASFIMKSCHVLCGWTLKQLILKRSYFSWTFCEDTHHLHFFPACLEGILHSSTEWNCIPTHLFWPTDIAHPQHKPFFMSFSLLKILPVSAMMWASPFSHKLSTDTPGFAASITILRASGREIHKQEQGQKS